MTTAADILTRARSLISEPAHWAQYAKARDKNGKPTSLYDPQAHSFCAVGAVQRAGYDLCSRVNPARIESPVLLNDHALQQTIQAFKVLLQIMGGFIDRFNDNHDHVAVLKAFDEAIKACNDINTSSSH